MATAARARAPAAPETRAKRAVANLGRTRSPETRAKMGAARLDPGPETRAKMAAARMATAARKRNKTGGVLGVYPTRNGTWRSLIRNGGEYRHIGTYSTQTLARAMRFVYLEAWPYREPS